MHSLVIFLFFVFFRALEHWWFRGTILACHAGSIPSLCNEAFFSFPLNPKTLSKSQISILQDDQINCHAIITEWQNSNRNLSMKPSCLWCDWFVCPAANRKIGAQPEKICSKILSSLDLHYFLLFTGFFQANNCLFLRFKKFLIIVWKINASKIFMGTILLIKSN